MTALPQNFENAVPLSPQGGAALCIGDIEVDMARYRAWRAGRRIELGARELHLLCLLMQQPGRVFTREQILNSVWGTACNVTDRNVDAYVKRLRRMLMVHGGRDPIRTVRSVGYAFDEFYQA